MSDAFSPIERNTIAVCCALSLLLFFFPLLSIHVPIGGDQEVSGYDVISKLKRVRENLKPSDVQSPSNAPTSAPDAANPPSSAAPNLPLSVETSWLIPLALVLAFLSAAVALIGAFTHLRLARAAATVGACSAALAILHITVMNSDIHSWFAASMKAEQATMKDNPFGGLAERMGSLFADAFQLKPGWGLYSLLVLLAAATALGFSRVLSRLQLAPSPKS